MKRTILAVLTLTLASAYQAPAQEAPPPGQDGDPSGRAVARLSLLLGDVSVRRGDSGEWVAAAVNAPLMTEDQVLTAAGARAEVQFDYAHFARLSSDVEFRLADIENHRYLVRLARGTMTFRVLRSSEAQIEISTPSIAVHPLKKGIYRVSVLDDGSTEVTVRNGEAEIFSPRGTQKLKSGRTMLARGNASDPEFQFVNAAMIDDWDRWNESRDRQLETSRSYDYVSQDIYGAEDLDNHGRWENTPDYGNVWVPATTGDWAPYRNGRWTWVDYYGWNWISYDPWGWAPYHYGRWINRPNVGWCWWPGRIHSRHYWSPGLVAFFGWGRGGVSVGFGNYGWVPLAPFETYYPWYGRGYYNGYRNRTYNNITIVNNTNITNVYRNARVNNAITSVNANDFGRGSVNHVRYNRNDIESASMVRGQLPLVPDAASTRMSDRQARVAEGRAASRSDSSFYSTRQASRVDRVPFENQRAAMQETSRRTFGDTNPGRGSDTFTGRVSGADRTMDRASERTADRNVGRGASNENNGGWRRFGDSSTPAPAANTGRGSSVDRGASRSSGNADSGGWRRFGDSTTPANSSIDRGSSSRGGQDSGSWRRMSETPSSNTNSDRGSSVDRGSFGRSRDNSSPQTIDRGSSVDRGSFGGRSSGSYDRGGRGSSGMDSAPRISAPPVVRERSTPRMESAPRMERSAPRMERSAPAPSNHGGGGGRGEGGGGSRGESRGGRNK